MGPELRYLRLGEIEIARRVSVVVRDRDWGTLEPRIESSELESSEAGFSARIKARCSGAGIEVVWDARILAAAQGITWEVTFEPLCRFQYNRIGLVVLHPVREAIGCGFRTWRGEKRSSGRLPERVAPQLLRDGFLQPLLEPFERLELDWPDRHLLRFGFEGDLFEMEDQRNWGDGSFKTYSTPIALGFPHEAREGEAIRQMMRLEVIAPSEGSPPRRRPSAVEVETLGRRGSVPRVGIAVGSRDLSGSGAAKTVARLSPCHLRISPGRRGDLQRIAEMASGRALRLELALAGHAVERVAADLAAAGLQPARVLLPGAGTRAAEALAAARAAWPGIPALAASDDHFAELNRDPPSSGVYDGLAFPLSPQVHQFDEDSLRESLESLESVAASAVALAGGGPVYVTPLTLRPRHGPGSEARDGDPVGTDSRLHGSFAAAWTLGAIAALGAGGAAAVTAYELTGPRGVADLDGRLLAVGELLAELIELAGLPQRQMRISQPMKVAALVAERRQGPVFHLANLTADSLPVRVDGDALELGPHQRVRLG